MNNRVTEDDFDADGLKGYSRFISSAYDESASIVADPMPVAERKKGTDTKVIG